MKWNLGWGKGWLWTSRCCLLFSFGASNPKSTFLKIFIRERAWRLAIFYISIFKFLSSAFHLEWDLGLKITSISSITVTNSEIPPIHTQNTKEKKKLLIWKLPRQRGTRSNKKGTQCYFNELKVPCYSFTKSVTIGWIISNTYLLQSIETIKDMDTTWYKYIDTSNLEKYDMIQPGYSFMSGYTHTSQSDVVHTLCDSINFSKLII